MEALEGILGAIPPMTIQEQVTHSIRETSMESTPTWVQRYAYLPPRQRAGRILQVARTAKRLTPTKLSTKTGIGHTELLEMEQGFRAITEDEARKIACVLNVDYRQLVADCITEESNVS
jgi:ribosome-binding protein aMBF1 (putative translation factor)